MHGLLKKCSRVCEDALTGAVAKTDLQSLTWYCKNVSSMTPGMTRLNVAHAMLLSLDLHLCRMTVSSKSQTSVLKFPTRGLPNCRVKVTSCMML